MRLIRPLVLLLLFATPAFAETVAPRQPPTGLSADGRARVTEVVDGDTVVLDDRRQVRLVGLQAPKLPLGRPNFPTWPLAEESKAELAKLVQGRTVELRYGGARKDRHGRALAHLVRDDGLWVQGEMLRRGMARVYTFPDNRAAVAEMLALEAEARKAKAGMWALAAYAVLTPEQAAEHIGDYVVVEGRVVQVATRRDVVYVNFGPDWRTDFTVTMEPKLAREIGATRLEGRRVQVRGWLRERNGAMIELTHGEQLVPLP